MLYELRLSPKSAKHIITLFSHVRNFVDVGIHGSMTSMSTPTLSELEMYRKLLVRIIEDAYAQEIPLTEEELAEFRGVTYEGALSNAWPFYRSFHYGIWEGSV